MNILETVEDGRCYIIDKLPGHTEARLLSAEWGAKVWRGQSHLTRGRGNKPGTVYLVEKQREKVFAARASVQKLTGKDDPGYAWPQLARSVTEWLGIRQAPLADVQQLLPKWHYQHVIPTTSPECKLYDLTAAYWQIVERARSPIFDVWNGRIAWRCLSVQQEKRWNAMQAACKEHKALRLAIVGCNAAGRRASSQESITGHDCWYRGRPVNVKTSGHYTGPLQPLSLLAVRSIYEVCQIQSEQADSLYSNADCVCTESIDSMYYWDSLGMEYKLKYEGAGEIRAVGAWRIGGKNTDPFNFYHQEKQWRPLKAVPLVDPIWHRRALSIN